ncbi:MAG: hypothetical protein HOP28_08770 [Gemmatimonadales bacterium]|nr:hypothetical protein [Gemmatimonadales bacterium]
MRQFWVAAHLLGFVAWMGGAFAAMTIGTASRQEPRDRWGAVARLQGAIYTGLVLPGAICTVISGLVLTLSLYGQAASVGIPRFLMLMQGTGLLAALLTLVVIVPTSARLVRLDPVGPHAALFDRLRAKLRFAGMISAFLALLALVAGAMLR